MHSRIIIPLVALILVGSAGVAPAQAAAEPLPFTPLSPPDGATLAAGQSGTPFGIALQAHSDLIYGSGEVSTSTLTGVDGSLADDFVVGTFFLFESDAFPGTFTGHGGFTSPFSPGWQQTPGTYYWQFGMRCYWYNTSCGGTGVCCTDTGYLSPVRRVVVTPPPATGGGGTSGGGNSGGGNTSTPQVAGIRKSDVAGYVRTMLRQRTDGRVRGLVKECSGQGSPRVSCFLTWRIGRLRYEGSLKLTHYLEGGEAFWKYSFKGKRKKIGCRTCRAKRIRW